MTLSGKIENTENNVINKKFVAIVDGNIGNRNILASSLMYLYDVINIDDSVNAIDALIEHPPSAILVGEKAGRINGVSFIRLLRQVSSLKKTIVIFIADKQDTERTTSATLAGANDFLVKPFRKSTLIKTVSDHLNACVERDWEKLPPLEQLTLKSTIGAFCVVSDALGKDNPLPFHFVKKSCAPLVDAVNNNEFKKVLEGIKNHDNHSYVHSLRVATFLSIFGKAAGLKKADQLTLASAGLLHDTGKMAIPHEILNKPGVLNETERAIMKSHVPETVRHLRACPEIPRSVITIAEQHHEKLNGQGYPHGLQGTQLNELVRMAAIVDVFAALTERRPYKAELKAEKALAIMMTEMPGHLDLRYLKAFREVLLDSVN
jgi:putative nucleotidyltransferase with HDIG domain